MNHFVIAFATYEWQLYVGMLFSATAFCATTLCRSMISKFVAPHEVGKVFAIVGAIQVCCSVVRCHVSYSLCLDPKTINEYVVNETLKFP